MPDYYRDLTHIDIENWVDMDKVDEIHKQLARWLREKMYGLDVREALARLVEQTSSDLFDANQVALALEQLAISLEEKWNEEYQSLTDEWKNTLAGVTVDDEVINARIDLRGFVYKTLKERLDAMQAISDKLNPVSEVFSIEHNQNCYPVVRVLAFENGLGVVPLGESLGASTTISLNSDIEYIDRNSLKVKVPLVFAMANPTTERISANEYLLVEGIKSLIIEVGTKAEANVETFVTREILSDFNTPPKIADSNVENANNLKWIHRDSLVLPNSSGWNAATQVYINMLYKLDNIAFAATTAASGLSPQILTEYNIFWIIEKNFPSIFKNATTAEKVAIAKKTITLSTVNAYAKGSGPNGNKVTMSLRNPRTNAWEGARNNATPNIGLITYPNTLQNALYYMDDNGIMPIILYAEASSATIQSVVSVDYTNIKLTARVPFSKI